MTDITASDGSVRFGEGPTLTHSWSEGRAVRNGLLTIGAWVAAMVAVRVTVKRAGRVSMPQPRSASLAS